MKKFIQTNWEYLILFIGVILIGTFSAFSNRESYSPEFITKKVYVSGGYITIIYERNTPQYFHILTR